MTKKRIMVVDDEPAFVRMMKLVLEKHGPYEVICETNSAQAVETARCCKPDLVLLDVVMPEIDGGDVAARMHADEELKSVPIIFLTALVSEKETQNGPIMRAGYRFLGKLTSDNKLFDCIEQNLRM